MATLDGTIGRQDRCAGQRQVADGIEDFVPYELLRIAQALAVDDPVVGQGDGVFKRGSERQAGLPQALDIAHEAKGTGPTDLVEEGSGIHFQRHALASDQGRGKFGFKTLINFRGWASSRMPV